jgi:serine/threonine protein kinase
MFIPVDNILYSNNGRVHIADFGVATNYIHGNEMETKLQNLNYRAPELIFGIAKYNYKVDIYNMGVVFWRLLTGKPLFDFKNKRPDIGEIFALHGS